MVVRKDGLDLRDDTGAGVGKREELAIWPVGNAKSAPKDTLFDTGDWWRNISSRPATNPYATTSSLQDRSFHITIGKGCDGVVDPEFVDQSLTRCRNRQF